MVFLSHSPALELVDRNVRARLMQKIIAIAVYKFVLFMGIPSVFLGAIGSAPEQT